MHTFLEFFHRATSLVVGEGALPFGTSLAQFMWGVLLTHSASWA